MHKFFSMCLFLFITLYMFRAHSAHHQEKQIVSIQPLVTVILCWWPRCVQSLLPTCTHLSHQPRMTVIRGCIDTICLSRWCVLKTCRVINRNKHIEKNLCITLVIYQESLHDARQQNVKCDDKFCWSKTSMKTTSTHFLDVQQSIQKNYIFLIKLFAH